MIPLGIITSSHGVRGNLKVKSFTSTPSDIINYGPLYLENGQSHTATIVSESTNYIILHLSDVNSKTEADKLQGSKLLVPKQALPMLGSDEYYYNDLIGAKVFEDTTLKGEIVAMQNFGAGEIMVIKLNSNQEIMLPFDANVIKEINLDKKIIYINKIDFL